MTHYSHCFLSRLFQIQYTEVTRGTFCLQSQPSVVSYFSGSDLAGCGSNCELGELWSQNLCDQDPVVWDFPGQKTVKNTISKGMALSRKAVEFSTRAILVITPESCSHFV